MGRQDLKTVSTSYFFTGNKNEVKIMKNRTLLIILAILLAPVAVYLKKGVGKDLLINILLCFLFYIPAVIHALILVTK